MGDELPALRAAANREVARQRIVAITINQDTKLIGAALTRRKRDERIGLIVTQRAGLAMSRYALRHPFVIALGRFGSSSGTHDGWKTVAPMPWLVSVDRSRC